MRPRMFTRLASSGWDGHVPAASAARREHLFIAAAATADRLAALPFLTLRLLGASAAIALACTAFGYGVLGPGNQHQLFRDVGPASLTTSLLILAAAVVGLLVAHAEGEAHNWRDVNNFWFLSGIGFVYLSIDGPLDIHGTIGDGLVNVSSFQSVPGIHRMSDAVLIAYAVIGAIAVVLHRRELARHPRAITLILAGLIATAISLALDAGGRPTPWLVVAEESVELVGASLFLSAYTARYRALRTRLATPPPVATTA